MTFSKSLAAAFACAVIAAFPAAGQTADDPLVATVNGTEIHLSEIAAVRATLPSEYRDLPVRALLRPLTDILINRKLVVAAAREDGLLDDPEVKRAIAEETEAILEQYYLDRRVAADMDDSRLREAYREMAEALSGEEEVRARHILVDSREKALGLVAELEAGADFATLAEANSTGPTSAQGGDLGYFTKDQMVSEFAEAAFALDVGEVTESPVQTQFGWHVIKVEDRRDREAPSYEESVDRLREEQAVEIMQDVVATLRSDAEIERFEVDLATPGAPQD